MSFENFPQPVSEQNNTEEKEHLKERLLPPKSLRYIRQANELLHTEPGEDGLPDPEKHWTKLYETVKPWESALELSDNIREVIRERIAERISGIKEGAHTIREFSDEALLNTLTNNWFEEVENEMRDSEQPQRRAVLLAVMAHTVKRMETVIWQKILQHATEEDLQKLALNPSTRDLCIDVLQASSKMDALFIRFLAYTQLSEEPAKGTKGVVFSISGEKPTLHTIAEMFPREATYIEKSFGFIADGKSADGKEARDASWKNMPGGAVFQEYVETIAKLFREKDPKNAEALQKSVRKKLYGDLVRSDFPLQLTPSAQGYTKEPYVDPEFTLSIATPDSKQEDTVFKNIQSGMAESLSELSEGSKKFANRMKKTETKTVVSIESFGAGLRCAAVADTDPVIIMFLNEQRRAYDKNFPEMISENIENGPFQNNSSPETRGRIEQMSRTLTQMHEFAHDIYFDGTKESKRLGKEPLTTIDEVKSEIALRALIPSLLEKQTLEGTLDEWAAASVTSSLQMLKDQPEGDDYFSATIYTLQRALREKAIQINENRIEILDAKKYFDVQKEAAKEVIRLFEDESVNETKARGWMKRELTPEKEVMQLKKRLAQSQ